MNKQLKKHLYFVIMAGGKGTRFWPVSRQKMPKQLLEITGKKSMIQETVDRVSTMVSNKQILVVTDQAHARELKKQLPKIPAKNVLIEPVGRNTAPCIGLAASHLIRRDPEAIMIVLPADHYIVDVKVFQKQMIAMAEVASQRNDLVTVGIPPTRPETGYGYIHIGNELEKANNEPVFEVKGFREKPNLETAEEFIKTGDFLWNSGMFAWKASVILMSLERHLPKLFRQLIRIRVAIGTDKEKSTLHTIYPELEEISIDYGVMEKAQQVSLIKGRFGWNDVGNWSALEDIWPHDEFNNTHKGKPVISINSKSSIVYSQKKLVALVYVEDLIVVDTDDALLICRKDKAQDIKKVVDKLDDLGYKKLL